MKPRNNQISLQTNQEVQFEQSFQSVLCQNRRRCLLSSKQPQNKEKLRTRKMKATIIVRIRFKSKTRHLKCMPDEGLFQQLNESESRNSFRSSVLSRRVYQKDKFVFVRASPRFRLRPPPSNPLVTFEVCMGTTSVIKAIRVITLAPFRKPQKFPFRKCMWRCR